MKLHRTIAAAVLAALLLSGCGDNDKEAETGDPTDSSSPSPSETGPEPTDGVLVDEPLFSFRLPEGWELRPLIDTEGVLAFTGRAPENGNPTNINVAAFTTVNFDDVTQLSPDVLEHWEQGRDGGQALAPTDWAGQRVYHFSSDDCSVGYCEQFGLNYKDHWVVFTLDFVTPASQYVGKLPDYEHTPAQIQEIIAAVEASWEWK